MIIEHKFLNQEIDFRTKLLIIGTFNPNTIGNEVSFFYGRPRNFLWKYLPLAYNVNDLKYQDLNVKFDFMKEFNIDFIDLIKSVDVEEGEELNFDDDYIDARVNEWNPIIEKLESLENIEKIIFTRSTFNGVPNILEKLEEIENYCRLNEIETIRMKSPARFWRLDRQQLWNNFINY